MKASELMIGDWMGWLPTWKNEETGEIEWDGDRNQPIIGKVGMLMKDCTTIDYCDESIEVEDIGLIPLPLTPEILEKNGWEEIKEYEPYIYYLLKVKDSSISLSKEWDSTTKTVYWSLSIGNHITDASLSVDYIHELQHTLRLCGIEKEIEL